MRVAERIAPGADEGHVHNHRPGDAADLQLAVHLAGPLSGRLGTGADEGDHRMRSGIQEVLRADVLVTRLMVSEQAGGPDLDPDVLDAAGLLVVHEGARRLRSEEHTSELQSLMRISYAVFCLKKKKK